MPTWKPRPHFVGEGHCKVWARLRILRNIRVSQDRIGRQMRRNSLLSLYRVTQKKPLLHEGSTQIKTPDLMWRTEVARIETVEDS